jgi:hypothetical protein
MNLPRPFLSRPNPFSNFLTGFKSHRPSKSIDSIDSDPRASIETPHQTGAVYRTHSRTSSGDAEPSSSGIPLIDYSRTPSPSGYNVRTRSATQSEDEDDTIPLSLRPLVSETGPPAGIGGKWNRALRDGGLGAFLFGTWAGWQVYVGLVVAWHVGAGILLVFFNRVVLWSGVYKYVLQGLKGSVQCLIWSADSHILLPQPGSSCFSVICFY